MTNAICKADSKFYYVRLLIIARMIVCIPDKLMYMYADDSHVQLWVYAGNIR